MKIKNMKLMLVGLLAMMGVSNAFAAVIVDEEGRSVNGINYQCISDGDNHYAIVVGVNNKASEAEQKTISIPATIQGEKFTYKVQEFKAGWDAAIKPVTGVTTSLSIDVTNFTAQLTGIDDFTKLESLTITDTGSASKNKKLDLSAASFAGTLKTLNISGSKIEEIAADGLKNFAKLETIDLGQIKTIGANAFDGCAKVKSLTVPATVTSVGANAFDNMTDLETVVWNSKVNIPASAFAGSTKIKAVTVANADITTIGTGAFGSTKIETIDLSGSPKLATITGAFEAANKYKKVLLAGTAITDITTDPSLAASAGTLEEITFPAKITTLPAFTNFVKLKKVDLSGTGVKAIPANEFQGCKVMTEAILNAETASIGAYAFEGCVALATVTNLGNAKMATIDEYAFAKTVLTAVDLSATAVTMIRQYTFADNKVLESVKLSNKITGIAVGAFSHCVALASLNLEDTKITTLRRLFTAGADDETAPCDALKSLKLPETLKTVDDYALQMTGIEEIEIPSSVTTWGDYVLQGCLNLKKFIWENIDPLINLIGTNTFLGDDKMEEVRFITKNVAWGGISDNDFKGNDLAVLKVYVNAETYAALVAGGWTPANTKWATLVGEAETEFAFNEKGKSAVDDFYYATYYNDQCDTWFPEADFEVFSAILDGKNIKLVEAEKDNGYYKVAMWDGTYLWGGNHKESVCVVRSKKAKANVEYKYNVAVYSNTMPSDNALQVSDGSVVPSRLKYQYKLGVKDGQVKFWRITSGTLKADAVFIESTNPKAPEFMDIVIEGEMNSEATAIDAIQTVNEESGAIYNLQGVQVKNAKKGLYIQNGQKFIVK